MSSAADYQHLTDLEVNRSVLEQRIDHLLVEKLKLLLISSSSSMLNESL